MAFCFNASPVLAGYQIPAGKFGTTENIHHTQLFAWNSHIFKLCTSNKFPLKRMCAHNMNV